MRIKAISRTKTYAGVVVVVTLALLVVAFMGLQGYGLRAALVFRARALVSTCKAVFDSSSVVARGDFTNVIFLHHSTGRNLIEQGGVREMFTAAGYDFWDHGYNHQGLTQPDGKSAGYSYNIPDDNTDPDGFVSVFSQKLYPKALNAFSGLLQHKVIIFKSCFPVSNITSDAQLEQYQFYYLEMRDVMDEYPDRVFIIVTPPPLNPAATDAEAAARARAFAEWLGSEEFLGGHPNVYTFDFFDLLAEDDPAVSDYNMLREAYREGEDSHPNQWANETVAPVFVEFIIGAIEDYRVLGGGVSQ